MVDLVAKTPAEGLLPIRTGAFELNEIVLDPLWAIAPYEGRDKQVSAALKKAVKLGLPKTGEALEKGDIRLFWAGQDHVFLAGAVPPVLDAAVSVQSDAWCAVRLSGAGWAEVLARLCPLDFREMGEGDAARSLVGHMAAILLPRADGIDILVFRAFAKTLVHELSGAMQSVAAQEALPR